MANQIYKSFEELPVMLTIPQVASVLSISRAGAYELAHRKNFPGHARRKPDCCSKGSAAGLGRPESV